ncbi:two-component sensor histidine kinase, partial [Streptomyces sp. NPDC059744]
MTLIAVVAAVIGSVTTIAFHSYMYGKLDDQLRSIAMRASKPPPGGRPLLADGPDDDPLAFIDARGQPFGTLGAVSVDGSITASSVVQENSAALEQSAAAGERPLKGAEEKALEAADIEVGAGARSVDLPGLGSYRVTAVEGADGTTTVLVGIPAAEVRGALTTLILVEVCVTGAGLIAAGIAGAAMVGVALRPRPRVAPNAPPGSELPLHNG